MSDIEKQTGLGQPGAVPSENPENVRKVWIFNMDMDYFKTVCGILELGIAALSFIALICCVSGRTLACDDAYASTYNFFGFISGSTFGTMLLWFFFHLISLNTRFVSWKLWEMIVLGVFGIMYLIADIVIAAQPCGKDSNRAAAAFGFFTFFAMGAHFFLSFQAWRETEAPDATRSPQDPVAEDNTKY